MNTLDDDERDAVHEREEKLSAYSGLSVEAIHDRVVKLAEKQNWDFVEISAFLRGQIYLYERDAAEDTAGQKSKAAPRVARSVRRRAAARKQVAVQ